jgi:hypothetical protein
VTLIAGLFHLSPEQPAVTKLFVGDLSLITDRETGAALVA